MAAAIVSASEFFEGAAGSLVWLLCAFAAGWLMFYAPLGRRVLRHRISIGAPPEKVWSAMMLEPSPPGGWAGVMQIERQQFLEGPPLRHEAVVGFPARPGVSKTVLSRVIHVEPAKRLETELESIDGVVVLPANTGRVVLTLTEEDGATRLEQEACLRIRGIFGHLSIPRFYDRYYDHFRAHCEGSPAPARKSVLSRSAAVGLGVAAVAASAVMFGADAAQQPVWFYVLMAVCLEAAILLHEFGHYLVMRAFGHRDASIVLIPFFGGATLGARPMSSRYEQAMVALGGPALSALLVSALAPVANWGVETGATDIDLFDILAASPADNVKSLTGLFLVPLLVMMLPLNLINLAPVGMLDGGKVVGALASGRIPRALLITAVFAVLGYSTLQWGTADYFGSAAALLVAVWVYQLLSRHAPDQRLEPMSRWQSATTLAALVVTLAIYVEASRTLLPDLAMTMTSGFASAADHGPASTSCAVRDNQTAAP